MQTKQGRYATKETLTLEIIPGNLRSEWKADVACHTGRSHGSRGVELLLPALHDLLPRDAAEDRYACRGIYHNCRRGGRHTPLQACMPHPPACGQVILPAHERHAPAACRRASCHARGHRPAARCTRDQGGPGTPDASVAIAPPRAGRASTVTRCPAGGASFPWASPPGIWYNPPCG